MSGTDMRLREAYESTAYRVDEGPRGGFVIRVGERSADADALLAIAGATDWAFITACNPRSVALSTEENAARMARLARLVRDRGLAHYRGAGVGVDASWTPEPSLLVLGLAEHEAVALARAFELEPANPAVAYNLSDLLYRRGDYERARFYVSRVNAVPDYTNAQSLWLAARIEKRAGNAAGLEDAARKLRDRFPQSPETALLDQGKFDE